MPFLRLHANVYPQSTRGTARVIAFDKPLFAAGHGVLAKQHDNLPCVLMDAALFDEFMAALLTVEIEVTTSGQPSADAWNKVRAIASRMKPKP